MEPTIEMQDTRQEIKKKLREHFDGKMVSIAHLMMTPSLSLVYSR